MTSSPSLSAPVIHQHCRPCTPRAVASHLVDTKAPTGHGACGQLGARASGLRERVPIKRWREVITIETDISNLAMSRVSSLLVLLNRQPKNSLPPRSPHKCRLVTDGCTTKGRGRRRRGSSPETRKKNDVTKKQRSRGEGARQRLRMNSDTESRTTIERLIALRGERPRVVRPGADRFVMSVAMLAAEARRSPRNAPPFVLDRGWTLVHEAALNGRPHVLLSLCAANADLLVMNRHGVSPLDVALQRFSEIQSQAAECVSVLVSNGVRLATAGRQMLIRPWMVALESGRLNCRCVIVSLLGLKRRRGAVMREIDRFVVTDIAVCMWATRGDNSWQPRERDNSSLQ